MLVQIKPGGDSVDALITVTGEVDLDTADDLKTAILLAIASGHRNISFDLAGVTLLDSIGLGVLVSGSDYVCSKGGAYRVARATPEILHLLEVTGLDKLVQTPPPDAENTRRAG